MDSLNILQQTLKELPAAATPSLITNGDHTPSNGIDGGRPLHVEVCRQRRSVARREIVEANVLTHLRENLPNVVHVPLTITTFAGSQFLQQNVASIHLVMTEDDYTISGATLASCPLEVHIFQLNEEGQAMEELEHDGEQVNAASHWTLPSREFDGMWESLIYDRDIKQQLLNYAKTALLFSDKAVCSNIVSWNRVVLLHGPPGTGKTSLCKALAHKLAIRLSHRYQVGELIEVNSHSLFSKWFSESGKLVSKMFQRIQDYVEDRSNLVCVLIDEVESLTAVRQAALSGSEPSDAIRVVNALLTQLDQLKRHPNVLVLTTSNITDAIDLAFVDRADIRQYIGPPSVQAIYTIYSSCLTELMRVGIIDPHESLMTHKMLAMMRFAENRVSLRSLELWRLSEKSVGVSGRALRKLPFLAHARYIAATQVTLLEYIQALDRAVTAHIQERNELSGQNPE